MKLLTIVGTRPEAVKMAPVLRALNERPGLASILCTTGQHEALCDEPLGFFGLGATVKLKLMEEGESLNQFMARAIAGIDDLLASERPDRVIVQGDTSSALAAALAAFNRRIPVSHVEAGLRTYNPAHPWPEETNRRTIDLIADQLFAPTAWAARNLSEERIGGQIRVTGNSGVDALLLVIDQLASDPALRRRSDAAIPAHGDRPLILATVHRRENIGDGISGICDALASIARRGMAEIMMPVHPNLEVRGAIEANLAGLDRIHLLPPLPLPAMVRLMQRADLILTDSGGVQEEAPSLGKRVLVLREATERPEAVDAGLACLVGTCPSRILTQTEIALAQVVGREARPIAANPFGDGRAAGRIVAGLLGEQADTFEATHSVLPGAPLRLAS